MTVVGDQLGPYRILARIGAGGMGEVFRARDVRLGREVAVKLLSPRLASAPAALDRFEREARAVAALSHPNIVALYDVGRHDGKPYVVMELVAGETLSTRIARSPMPVRTAVGFALQAARAVTAAHEKGVIHRDLKSDNLKVTPDGTLKVLDFGLAKMAELDDATTAAIDSTQPGAVFGTVGYSPPEQLRGEGADHRADIFSLGVILHEMLTGRRPFERSTPVDVIAAMIHGERDALPRSVPGGVAAIVERCLASRPEQRFQSARELAGALEAVEPAPAGGGAEAAAPARARLSVAVMPFGDLSPQRDHDHFCDGIAEELMTTLGRLPDLDVVAKSATVRFKGGAIDAREAGRLLNASTIVEGGVQAAGGRLRASVRINDARSGLQVWSHRFDGEAADLFALQDAIGGAVSRALQGALGRLPQPELRPTDNVRAYTAYLKGRHEWNRRTEEALKRSVASFEEAVALDPGYAPAYAALAEAFLTLGLYGAVAPGEVMGRARTAAETALRLNPALPEARSALACVEAVYDWNWAAAGSSFRQALALDHGYARAHQWYAINYLVPQARFAEAAREAQAALAIEPLSPVVSVTAGLVPFFAGDPEGAIAAFGRTLALDASFAMTHFFLGQACAASGDFTRALDELELAGALASGSPETLATAAAVLAQAGRTAEAHERLARLERAAETRYVSPCLFAQVHAGLGASSRALGYLADAESLRATDLIWVGARPVFRPLHGEAAFRALAGRVGIVVPRSH